MVVRELLFAVCWIALANGQGLPECRRHCLLKVPSGKICEEACQKASENNVTHLNQVARPGPPRLVLSTFFGMKLQWDAYSPTPLIYILEVTQHMDQGGTKHINTSDPTLILPDLEKYHIASENTLLLSQLVIKAAYSFRIAIVTLNETSAFSNSSEPYETNSSCSIQPCPVSNPRFHVDILEKEFEPPSIRAYVLWDRPEDFASSSYELALSFETMAENSLFCNDHLTHFFQYDGLNQNSNQTEIAENDQTPYFGCLYSFSLTDYSSTLPDYPVHADFFFPHCFQGFCGCATRHGGIPVDSEHIWTNVQRNGTSFAAGDNVTQVTVTWSTARWLGKDVSYFRINLHSKQQRCEFQSAHKVASQPNNLVTNYSYVFYNVCEGQEFRIHIQARNSSGCGFKVEEGVDFVAVVPLPTTPTSDTVVTSSLSPSQTPFTSLPGTSPRLGRSESATLVAAITVPLVGLLLGVLLLAFYFRFRRKKAPSGNFRRTPTGLQRCNANGSATHVYMRNLGDSSVSCNSNDRGVLVVDLPQKCADGGLELNPAYVEQRIHEALEAGEVDDFEFGYHRLELGRVLGKGAFGLVYLADAYGICGDTGRTTVAVKVLKDSAHEEEMADFRTEIGFMKTVGQHQNVVAMLGCCTLYPPLCLIVEYVPHGDLLRYLRELRKKFEQENRLRPREPERPGMQSEPPAQWTSGDSTNTSYSKRPLMPSLSDTTASSRIRLFRKAKLKNAGGLQPLCQSNSEPPKKFHRSLDAICFKKFDKFFEQEPGSEDKKSQRATAGNTLAKGLAAFLPLTRSAVPEEGPYVGRDEQERPPGDENPPASPGWTSCQTSSPRPQDRSVPVDGALDSSDLQSFAYQIANGMAYLSEKGIVHRDLAARNILVGDDKVLKISDFGLSKDGTYVKNSTGKIPLRWLSTEAMRDRFYSTASDVWAFGIVLWEICTLGEYHAMLDFPTSLPLLIGRPSFNVAGGFPYPTVNDRDLLVFLMEGNRMEKPSNCTDAIYEIMLACWSRELDSRPSFQALREILWELEKEDHPYVNVDPCQDFVLPPVGNDATQNLILFSDNTTTVDGGKVASPAEFPSLANVPDVNALSPNGTAMDNRGYRRSVSGEVGEVDEIAV